MYNSSYNIVTQKAFGKVVNALNVVFRGESLSSCLIINLVFSVADQKITLTDNAYYDIVRCQ